MGKHNPRVIDGLYTNQRKLEGNQKRRYSVCMFDAEFSILFLLLVTAGSCSTSVSEPITSCSSHSGFNLYYLDVSIASTCIFYYFNTLNNLPLST
ncbi:hypothetical protein F5Y03DRAFT_374706 [Xylaria venustula]|nr:hypothetical protein F5Y03DRAFT_374706 [Xylaria venustula]